MDSNMGPEKNEQLSAEAEFADSAYTPWENDLTVNQGMFEMYAHPRRAWNPREVSAMMLGPVAGKRLFDFGCGMGEESIYFALLGAEVHSMDISSKGVEIARKRAAFNHLTITAQCGDVLKNGYPDNYFDLMYGYGILHHVGLERGLQECVRLLKPGGKAVFVEHMSSSKFVDHLRESLPQADETHTEYEKPLTWRDCLALRPRYKVQLVRMHFLSRLRVRMPFLRAEWVRRLDHALFSAVPPLQHFAGLVVIGLEK
jgi:SAM-dependent methyltransferase